MRMDRWGRPLVDWPRYQRLAAPVTVYIEMFTAHPLESDVRELYAPPDGYVDSRAGSRRRERVRRQTRLCRDAKAGRWPLRASLHGPAGQWPTVGGRRPRPGAPFNESRQTFVADASRIFEEIERNGGEIYVKANYDFYRAVPSGGYRKAWRIRIGPMSGRRHPPGGTGRRFLSVWSRQRAGRPP